MKGCLVIEIILKVETAYYSKWAHLLSNSTFHLDNILQISSTMKMQSPILISVRFTWFGFGWGRYVSLDLNCLGFKLMAELHLKSPI